MTRREWTIPVIATDDKIIQVASGGRCIRKEKRIQEEIISEKWIQEKRSMSSKQ